MTRKIATVASFASLLLATAASAGPGISGPSYTPDLLPPSSHPGECWARVKVPAKHTDVTQSVMLEAPHESLRVTQPKFATRQESVMVKEPSVRFEVRQPTFRTVSEKILTRPGYEKLTVSPPRFSTVTETIDMAPPRLVWKKGNPARLRAQGYVIHSTADAGLNGRGYSSTVQYGHSGGSNCGTACEIWCLVEEPGVSKSFQRRVMSSPGEVRRHAVAPQYQTVTKQVVSDPGGVREVPVPGEFRNVTVHDLVAPADVVREAHAPKYGTVLGRVVAEDERYEWRRVVCQPGTARIQGSHTQRSHIQGGHTRGTYTHGTHLQGGHFGGSHTGHVHGSDHYSGSTHSGNVHSGHGHAAGQHPSHGTTYSQPGRYRQDELAGQRPLTRSEYYGTR